MRSTTRSWGPCGFGKPIHRGSLGVRLWHRADPWRLASTDSVWELVRVRAEGKPGRACCENRADQGLALWHLVGPATAHSVLRSGQGAFAGPVASAIPEDKFGKLDDVGTLTTWTDWVTIVGVVVTAIGVVFAALELSYNPDIRRALSLQSRGQRELLRRIRDAPDPKQATSELLRQVDTNPKVRKDLTALLDRQLLGGATVHRLLGGGSQIVAGGQFFLTAKGYDYLE